MSLAADLWQILTPRQRRSVAAMQGVSLLMAFSTAGGIASIAPFFAVLGQPDLIAHNAWLHRLYVAGGFSSRQSFTLALGAGFVGVVMLANLISVLGTLAMSRLSLRIGNELQTSLFHAYLSQPYAFHVRTSPTVLLNNVLYETNRITQGLLESAFVLVTQLVTAGLIIASITMVKGALAFAMGAALMGGYGAIYLMLRNRLLRTGAALSRLANEQTQIVRESLGAIREIIILQAAGVFCRRFERASRDYLRSAAGMRLAGQSPRQLMECIAAAALVTLAVVLGAREEGIGPWLGSLTFLAFAAYRLLPTLQQAFAAVVHIRADRAALALIGADLKRVRAAPPAIEAVDRPQCEPEWRERPRREIRLEGVSYRYAPDRDWALQGISLCIPARTTVGIVGPNGSGKSTLADLIAGLLTPDAGTIEIDGCALDDGNRAAWQGRISYVPQDVFLLDAGIAENIALGASGAPDRDRLLEASRLAQLDEVVKTLPREYAERIGEHGIALSGGQRQRIGIARALYRDASVLLLDEATAALDGLTEEELIRTLAGLHGRYTIVLIAHRIDTLRACDRIFQLQQGRLAGSSTYETLLGSTAHLRRSAGAA
ncbi:MAG TPA: ABC transporter ATP-binding protein [Steroidobacteraceae bacterium]|nr:ABC transporter ATP-binding protein [Steroidobacteraceae bacterium]